jgi:hypothetical protein
MKKPKPEILYPKAVASPLGVEIKFDRSESLHIGIRDALRLASELTFACGAGLKRIIEHVVTEQAKSKVFPKKSNRTH